LKSSFTKISIILLLCFSLVLCSAFTTKADNNQTSESSDEEINPFAFFAGKVQQSFTESESKIEAKELSDFIDLENKVIKSVTDELTWDYDKGLLEINTPKTQGVSGFLSKEGKVELDDIIIESNNEYASILVISLDNKPIKTSKQILIQAVTEDKTYGWDVENDTIKSLGELPINVKNLDATITLKKKGNVHSVKALDANGYVKEELKPQKQNGNVKITLAPNSMYTIVSKANLKASEIAPSSQDDGGTFVWWEGEETIDTNFPEHTEFSGDTIPDTRDQLSGGEWLTNAGTSNGEEAYATYEIEVPEDGEYQLWVRKFWQHGPFKWRFDDSEWTEAGSDLALSDTTPLRKFLEANWVNLGNVNMDAGTHQFEVKLLAKEGEALVAGFDAFVLTKEQFLPRGKIKPGEKSGLAEEGYWAFEPSVDTFQETPLDLSYLNEDIAGQSGYVRRNGSTFELGNGETVRFWAVNAGPDVIKQGKESIEYLAKRLAKNGVNMVRIHGDILDSNSNDLSKIDENLLDKIHYFTYAMKQEGIYVNLSYYFPLWINMKPEYGFEGYETIGNKHPFALLMFNEDFQQIYKQWAKKLLLTNNPYTGIPLAKDTAVAIVEIQNEDNYLFWTFGRNNIPEVQMNKLEKEFGNWLIEKYGSLTNAVTEWGAGSEQAGDKPEEKIMRLLDVYNITADANKTEGPKRNRMSDQLQFLVEHQKGFYEEMKAFYREEIGTKSMVSASNWTTADPKTLDSLERYTYTVGDVIDRHGYFNSPHESPDGYSASYSVGLEHTYKDRSALLEPEASIVQVNQVADYPHMISETGWTNPNRFKGESTVLWSTYGSLQGMDSIQFFALQGFDWEFSVNKFALTVPSIFGQFPGFSLMYRRGDITESKPVVDVTHSLEDLYNFKGSPIYETQALDQFRQ